MELVMDTRVTWDCRNLKSVEEAKKIVLGYIRAGYEVVKADGSPLVRFISSLEEVVVKAGKVTGRCVMKILSDKGDDRVVWDRNKGKEAKEAKAKFAELLGKGYKAYSVDESGNKKTRIEEFDVDAQEVILVPPTAKG